MPQLLPAIRPRVEPDAELMQAIGAILRSGRLSNDGPVVRRFEAAAAAFLGVPEAVAVSSGGDALLLALHALAPGGRVVLPSFTYVATVAAVVHCGLEPVYADIDPATWTLDPAHVAALLEADPGIGAVLPVTVYGVPPDLDAIVALADRRGVPVLLDDAHGFGTRAPLATPRLRTYSLHATKVLCAVEGGLVTGDPDRLGSIRRLRGHGVDPADPLAALPGYNSRLDEIRAAIGLHELSRLEETLALRRAHAERLRAAAVAAGFTVQRVPEGVASNFQNLALLAPGRREAVQAAFAAAGVEARRYFHPALHRLPAIAAQVPREGLPVTDAIADAVLILPLHHRMPEADVALVEAAIAAAGRAL